MPGFHLPVRTWLSHLADAKLHLHLANATFTSALGRPIAVDTQREKQAMLTPQTPIERQVGSPPTASQLTSDSLHRSILLVDIEGYSHPGRTNLVRARLRDTLYLLLEKAIGHLDITAGHYETKDQGDGVLVLFHPDVPKNRLLHPLITELAQGLVTYNAAAPQREQLRLRVVVHAGELLSDEHGYFGEDLDEAFALVNSQSLRTCMTQTTHPLLRLVTDRIYRGIVRHEPAGIDPASYRPIRIRTKGKKVYAWLQVPYDYPMHRRKPVV